MSWLKTPLFQIEHIHIWHFQYSLFLKIYFCTSGLSNFWVARACRPHSYTLCTSYITWVSAIQVAHCIVCPYPITRATDISHKPPKSWTSSLLPAPHRYATQQPPTSVPCRRTTQCLLCHMDALQHPILLPSPPKCGGQLPQHCTDLDLVLDLQVPHTLQPWATLARGRGKQ